MKFSKKVLRMEYPQGTMHIMERCSRYASWLLSLEPFVQPCDRLIHSLIGEGKCGTFLVLLRCILKTPWFGIDEHSECSTVFSVIAPEEVTHAVVAPGEWFFFQSPERDQSFIDHNFSPFCGAMIRKYAPDKIR